VLGICYGMQLMMHVLGGEVVASPSTSTVPRSSTRSPLPRSSRVCPEAADLGQPRGQCRRDRPRLHPHRIDLERRRHRGRGPSRRLYGIQFHPEVAHTEHGARILRNFLFGICALKPDWTMGQYMEEAIARIQGRGGRG
jgi:GMP synthase (glutamine-hydrolysing)